ncbi:hypothetical protein Lal_00034936 [Lupinus albus]|nr:hypothetical protein Lal_00034936 [Lupinus albus]
MFYKRHLFFSYRNYYKSQFIQQLDRWGYRIISLGIVLVFLFLNIPIVCLVRFCGIVFNIFFLV